MALESGVRLGPYEVVSLLGSGGMGEVYRARDTRLGRLVAIKILSEQIRGLPNVRSRFIREARTVSNLSHPNICVLYDVGEQDEIDYLVMELLNGETLADCVRRGPVAREDCLRYAAQIADALDEAHRQGVIHGDLKPANVFLTRGQVKLLDFGLAQAVASPTVTLAGTREYMAPEQRDRGIVDARTDIFSFGLTLRDMQCGDVSAIVSRCTAANPADRYASAAAIVGALSSLRPPRRWWGR